ncbi:8-amino-7-oxononanoate synthase [Methylocella sp.]|uniref:8-amino-7-oxononanoate synthase n=1 Tax=Methylocella sp. TaxID=1978226 RepID=UPI003784A2EA
MDSLDRFAAQKLEELEAAHLRRRLVPTAREDGVHVLREGRRLISFACNDYLGLSHHPKVKAAAVRAIERYGTGAGASRLVTGDCPLLEELEERLARFKGSEAAIVFGSGYLANAGIVPTLAGEGDLILIDELAHACLFAGAQLSPARTLRFRHNDVAHAAELLEAHRGGARRALMLTDGVFSMDGDLAPLAGLAALCAAHDAWLMSDDAHGLGVLAQGRGSAALAGCAPPLQMGTLSKAGGGYGGYLAASHPVVELLRARARTFVYSTGLPPANAAAALAALEIIESEPELTARPLARAHDFCEALGLPAPHSPIVPLVLGAPQAALDASARLKEAGFLVVAIRPPTVPEGTARLRFAFSALHGEDDVARLARAVAEIGRAA